MVNLLSHSRDKEQSLPFAMQTTQRPSHGQAGLWAVYSSFCSSTPVHLLVYNLSWAPRTQQEEEAVIALCKQLTFFLPFKMYSFTFINS